MGKRHPNWQLVKKCRNYTVEEIADLFGLHKNTVRAMLRDGLRPIDDRRPMLFLGGDLANFLRERRAKSKCPLKSNEMYCLRCREAREPAFGDVEYLPATPSGGNLRGLCPACSGLMHRRVSLARMHLMFPEWQARVRQGQEHIGACGELSLKCDLDRTPKP
jgi:Helix-turn-helix domain